tara:strand:+ start:295 stop:483 length:189 start_codon:yes stop_codon:yes gene_type:complete
MLERSLTGKKPPDEINVKAKFSESKDLIEKKFKIMKIKRVKAEYKRKIFIACFSISDVFNDM